jgi:2-amino-4-hydroxy-6-hydroxymethyldihydropteridine diphosphokinase
MAGLNRLVLSLGSNLGDREGHLKEACVHIEEKIGKITALSRIYDTPPLGFEASQSFYNVCLVCETALSPEAAIETIHGIEAEMGRVRVEGQYVSRTIDIDIVFFNTLIRSENAPLLPHPSYHLRKFVLLPLNDLDSEMRDPRDGRSVKMLLADCPDQSEIHPLKKILLPFHN